MDILETDAYDRRQRRNTSCVLFLSLIPFFLATATFFYLWTPDASPSVPWAALKASPVFLLALTVLSWNGGLSLLGVAGGLAFSSVGDLCLVWPELFLHGMAAFAVAHLQYSVTFLSARYASHSASSSACSRFLYLLMFLAGGAVYFHLYPFLQKAPDGAVLAPAVGVYVALLILMAALAIRTGQVATVLGSLSFVVSDLVLSLQVFKVVQIEHGELIVMITYYLAQLLIAVGDVNAVEHKNDFGKWKRS